MSHRHFWIVVAAASTVFGACTGAISDQSPGGGAGGPGLPGSGGREGGGDIPGPSARIARLTHPQWENTVKDLLRLPQAPKDLSGHFAEDPLGTSLFQSDTHNLSVSGNQWQDYQSAAEVLAERATRSTVLANILPAPAPADPTARAKGFIETFGRRAFRRPLSAEEVAEYQDLFAQGPAGTPVDAPFEAGVRLVVQAMLQSPYFLYRIETSEEPQGKMIPLGPYEVAARLSYLLSGSMPDDELLAGAADRSLLTGAGVESHARRLLGKPAARAAVRQFHSELFDAASFYEISKDKSVFVGNASTLPTSAVTEAERFVDSVVFEMGEGLNTLLTASFTFVNRDIAPIYKVATPQGSGMVRAELDPARRAGLLGQVGFLASRATPTEPSTIRRGNYVNRRFLCRTLSPPPQPPPPLPVLKASQTNRQRIEAHMKSSPTCQACHGTLINPIGFAFEHYDAVGAWRDTEGPNKLPIDASASYTLESGETITYDGEVELSHALAAASQVHECYLGNWVSFVMGRPMLPDFDAPLVTRLGAASRAGRGVTDLLLSIATSPAFLNRPTVEDMP